MAKEIYILKHTIMNDTIVPKTILSAFPTKELAQEMKDAIEQANKNRIDFVNMLEIHNVAFYDNREDIPILKHKIFR